MPNTGGSTKDSEGVRIDWQHLMAKVTFAFIFRASVTCEFLEPQPKRLVPQIRSKREQKGKGATATTLQTARTTPAKTTTIAGSYKVAKIQC